MSATLIYKLFNIDCSAQHDALSMEESSSNLYADNMNVDTDVDIDNITFIGDIESSASVAMNAHDQSDEPDTHDAHDTHDGLAFNPHGELDTHNMLGEQCNIDLSDDEQLLEDPHESLDDYEYEIDEATDIRLYNGVIKSTRHDIESNIELFKALSGAPTFGNIVSSLLSVRGHMTNFGFNDDKIISKLTLGDHRIIKIGCTSQEIYIFPNEYVTYNVAHLVDIVRRASLSMADCANAAHTANAASSAAEAAASGSDIKLLASHIRIECGCRNLLDHYVFILDTYKEIKTGISILRQTKLTEKIEKYLAAKKLRNRDLCDKIIAAFKKICNYVFHPHLFDNNVLRAMPPLFDKLVEESGVPIAEIDAARHLFEYVGQLIIFFKEYVAGCSCVSQPYDWNARAPLKIVSDDARMATVSASRSLLMRATANNTAAAMTTNNTAAVTTTATANNMATAAATTTTADNAATSKSKNNRKYIHQLLFEIYSTQTQKVYKVQLATNGDLLVKGIKDQSMRELLEPLTVLSGYLSQQFECNIRVSHLAPVMRYYVAHYKKDARFETTTITGAKRIITTHIFLDKLDRVCQQEKKYEYMAPTMALCAYRSMTAMLPRRAIIEIFKYMPVATLQLSEIANNIDRNLMLVLRIYKAAGLNKKMTIKVLHSGKFGFEGCNSELELYELYYWAQYLLWKYERDVVFNPAAVADFNYISDDEGDSVL